MSNRIAAAALFSTGLLASGAAASPLDRAALGEALFFDPNLSFNRTQSCATCHDPEQAFTDPRDTRLGRAVSLGDDGESLGDRNAPTIAYAAFTPVLRKTESEVWLGGMFHDGREPDLEGQAGGPPLNPIEMGMPDKAAVTDRLRENPDYVAAFTTHWGPDVFDDPNTAYRAMAEAIAAFERTDLFSPFDSKYDRYLRGTDTLTAQEELGRVLFFSEQFTNCNLCHQLQRSEIDRGETFSNYEYHNIGVPENLRVRGENGVAIGHVDGGLGDTTTVNDPSRRGQFKVPTLRNVAVTGPYMHNGVFDDLRTVILFYNKYNTRSEARQINPETGARWRSPEYGATLSFQELTHGPALDDQRIDALVAFLETLTDARYEHLLDD